MNVINFLVAILLPYVSLLTRLAPPDSVPAYFAGEDAAFLAGEFCAVVFYWAGFLRTSVAEGAITERRYFIITFSVLLLMCASRIIFALPLTWIISIFAFGLGVLSAPRGQSIGKKSLWFTIIISICIFIYTLFILVGLAWLSILPPDYYLYQLMLQDSLSKALNIHH